MEKEKYKRMTKRVLADMKKDFLQYQKDQDKKGMHFMCNIAKEWKSYEGRLAELTIEIFEDRFMSYAV